MPAQPASSDYGSHDFVNLLQGIGRHFSDAEQSEPVGSSPYTELVKYLTTLELESQSDDIQASITHGSPKNGIINTPGTRPRQL